MMFFKTYNRAKKLCILCKELLYRPTNAKAATSGQ